MFARLLLVLFMINTFRCAIGKIAPDMNDDIRQKWMKISERYQNRRIQNNDPNSTLVPESVDHAPEDQLEQTTSDSGFVSTGFFPVNIRLTPGRRYTPFDIKTHQLDKTGTIMFAITHDVAKIAISYDKDIFGGVTELTRTPNYYFYLPYTVTDDTIVNLKIGDETLTLYYKKSA